KQCLKSEPLAGTPQLRKGTVKGIRHQSTVTGSCMIHALAFSTLLSSQETDATTITQDPLNQVPNSGAFRFAFRLCLYSVRSRYSCQIEAICIEFRFPAENSGHPVSGATPRTYLIRDIPSNRDEMTRDRVRGREC
ncbi:hypothetical protein AB0C10_06890, partial [Microbispora amethystogenes]|uniref:hypothetical protein n=1 Tax=Microbispora amethystogenes TaxID=1427754 RepID=UPI0033E0B6B7